MSTYANFEIQDRDAIRRYILRKLGAPILTVELTAEQLDACIDDATELFTKYAVQDQQFLAMDLSNYVQGVGIQLPSNVVRIFSLSRQVDGGDFGNLFAVDSSLMYSLVSYNLPLTRTFSFVTYELANNYMDMVRMMGGNSFDFNYNERTKTLVLYPDPKTAQMQNLYIILGVYTVRSEEQIYGEDWVKRMALAESKILLGTIRKKFSSVQLLGGGSIDATIGDEGIKERDELREELQTREGPQLGFFVS